LGCVVFVPRVGTPCRVERELGRCETGDICTDAGTCRPTFVPADARQRCRPVNGPCDLGEFCDGESAECPEGVQCKADAGPLAGSEAIEVSCEAPATRKGRFRCSAVGFEPLPLAADGSETPDGQVQSCGRRLYTRKAAARLQKSGDAQSVHGRLTLPLKQSAHGVLESKGSVQVCVVVTVKFVGKTVSTERRLVTYR
jgi:hypothetical protein